MDINESVPNKEFAAPATKPSPFVADPDRHLVVAELLTAGSELSDATEQLLELMTQPGATPEQILDQAIELLSVYDELLEVLEIEIDSMDHRDFPGELPEDSNQAQKDLVGLYLIFDYDREVLRTVFGTIQAELLRFTPNKAEPYNELHKNPSSDRK